MNNNGGEGNISQNSFQSNFGIEVEFGEMRENMSRSERKKAWCSFIVDMVFLASVLLWLDFGHRNNSGQLPKCGIPILQWHEFFFVLLGIRSLLSLMRLYVARDSIFKRGHLEIFKLIVVDGVIIMWLIYGNRIFYSK